MIDIMYNWSYLLLAFVGGWQSGLLNAWQGLFDSIFTNYSEVFIGILGFLFIAMSTLGGIIGGIICDKFLQRKFKMMLLILFTLLGALLLVFTLSFPSFISYTPLINIPDYVICTILVICGILYGFCSPIFYEFGVELTYPSSTVISSGIYTLIINIITLLFLIIEIPSDWVTGIAALSILACILLLAIVREEYKRSDIDVTTYTAN